MNLYYLVSGVKSGVKSPSMLFTREQLPIIPKGQKTEYEYELPDIEIDERVFMLSTSLQSGRLYLINARVAVVNGERVFAVKRYHTVGNDRYSTTFYFIDNIQLHICVSLHWIYI